MGLQPFYILYSSLSSCVAISTNYTYKIRNAIETKLDAFTIVRVVYLLLSTNHFWYNHSRNNKKIGSKECVIYEHLYFTNNNYYLLIVT